ncbi:MAG: OmpA family protein [Bacteroidales bacterium]|nr:OmpA family protein [Bacteroidales bacterium]
MLFIKNIFFLIILSNSVISFAQVTDTLTIYYGIDAAELEGEWQNEIRNKLKNNVVDIKIYSYTDFLGSTEHNKRLSDKRANSTKSFLISQKVSTNLISECKGMGIHPFSSYTNRTNPDDRGVLQHRITKLVFIYDNEIKNKKNSSQNLQEKIKDTIEELKTIPMFADLSEEKLVIGDNIILDNIIFHGGTPIFKSESEKALKQLLIAMQNNPTLKIEIQGHICCQSDGLDGWDRINKNNELSTNRAKAVYDYLVKGGIETKRMTYIGLGSEYKRFPEERSFREEDLNRRVEILIIDK